MSSMALAAIFTVVLAVNARAQTNPMVVVSVANYSELASDMEYLAGLSGQGGQGLSLQNMDPTAFLDPTKPFGFVLSENGVLGFAPVTDANYIYGMLGLFIGGVEDVGDDVKKASIPTGAAAQDVYFKSDGSWLFFSDSQGAFGNLPANPESLLGGLSDKYDLAIAANLQNVPAQFRQLALGALREGMSQQFPGENDDAFQTRMNTMTAQLDGIEQVFDELEQISLGLAIDGDDHSISLDINMSAVPGSDLAAQLAGANELSTRFGGFVQDDAMLSISAVGEMSESDIQQAVAQMGMARDQMATAIEAENFPNDEMRETVVGIANGWMDLLEDTIKTGKMDMGLVVTGGDYVSGALGISVADGAKAEELFNEMMDFARSQEPQIDQILSLNAANVNGVRFHTITPPTNELGTHERQILGDSPVIAFGFGEDVFYIGFGTGIMETLEGLMADSAAMGSKTVPAFQATASAKSIMDFAAKSWEPAAMFANEIDHGYDHISITAINEGATSTMRIRIEEDVIKLLGKVGEMFQGLAAGAEFPN